MLSLKKKLGCFKNTNQSSSNINMFYDIQNILHFLNLKNKYVWHLTQLQDSVMYQIVFFSTIIKTMYGIYVDIIFFFDVIFEKTSA